MAKKVIEISLSERSIKKAIRELEAYKLEVNRKCEELAKRLAQEGVVVAKMFLMSYSTALPPDVLPSIQWKAGDILANESTYIIFTDSENAMFIEFGTGIVGAQNPHPDPKPVTSSKTNLTYTKYDMNEHGYKGWVYRDDKGDWHWTRGMPAMPYMYNTVLDLYTKVSKIAREVFS